MRIGLSYITQIRGSEDSGIPAPDETDPVKRLGGWVAQTVTQLVAALTAGYHTEHNDDDTHSTIHASGAIYERDRTTAIGDWTDVPFTAGLFFAAGSMTWTVSQAQQLVYAYLRVGTTLYVNYWIESSTLGGTASPSLKLTLPVNLAVAQYAAAATHYLNGTADVGIVKAVPGDTFISFLKRDESNWATASSLTLHGQVALKVSDGSGTVTVSAADPILTYAGAATGTVNFASASSLALTTAGTYTITVNRAMTLTFMGVAGGGGGASNSGDQGGGGGGGGATTTATTVFLTTGKTYTLVVAASSAAGVAGNPTTLVNTTDTITLVSLAGGAVGAGGGANAAGGALVTGSNGVTGGTGGKGGINAGAGAATAGGNATNGAAGGGGGGFYDAGSVQGAAGQAGGTGSVAGAAGTAGSSAVGGHGGNGGGAAFTGVSGTYGYGGGGNGGQAGAGNASGAGVGAFVFVSAP